MPLKSEPKKGTFIILLTFAIALTLGQIPLPIWLNHFTPEWATMVLIYWCLAIPHRVGMISGLLIGLLIDATSGELLGQHALSMVVISYLVLSFYQRIRISPIFQQALTIMGLLFLYHLLLFWFDRLPLSNTEVTRDVREFLFPPLGGFIVWPWLFIMMRSIRRRYKIK